MSNIVEVSLPAKALSATYQEEGAFADCYYIDIPRDVTLETYIKAFYTTPVFKIERTLLSIVTFKVATDSDAMALSLDQSERYSIWTVERRQSNQILLRDFTQKTRSWLMIEKRKDDDAVITRLFFGSVVVPKSVSSKGHASFGVLFHMFDRFHKFYSRMLLRSAYKSLLKDVI